VVIVQGDVCWAALPGPAGQGPRLHRPVLVVQGDAFNRSRVPSVVCVPLTSNLEWGQAPGNVFLPARSTGLAKDAVANLLRVVTLDRAALTEHAGRISKKQLDLVLEGLDLVTGR
jgi:mRNA interferase MazF